MYLFSYKIWNIFIIFILIVIFILSRRTILLITLRGYGSVFPWDERIWVKYRKKWREGVRGGTIAEIDDEDFVEDAVT